MGRQKPQMPRQRPCLVLRGSEHNAPAGLPPPIRTPPQVLTSPLVVHTPPPNRHIAPLSVPLTTRHHDSKGHPQGERVLREVSESRN